MRVNRGWKHIEMCENAVILQAVLHAAYDSYLHGSSTAAPLDQSDVEGNGCYGNMAAILQQMQGAFDGVLVPKFVWY